MKSQYTRRKVRLVTEEIELGEISLSDGSKFKITNEEIIDLRAEYYDGLVMDDGVFLPMARSGHVKLRISDSESSDNDEKKRECLTRLCRERDYLLIAFYDDISRRQAFFASVTANAASDNVTLTFHEIPGMGEAGGGLHTVTVEKPELAMIDGLELCFDNGDHITLASEEIIDIELDFKSELSVEPYSGYYREVKGGQIRLYLRGEVMDHHADDQIFLKTKDPTPENLERRIVGAGKNDVDICEIRVKHRETVEYESYENAPFHGTDGALDERISVPDMKEPPYVIIDNLTGRVSEYFGNLYVSGYGKREADGSILIVLGRSVEYAGDH